MLFLYFSYCLDTILQKVFMEAMVNRYKTVIPMSQDNCKFFCRQLYSENTNRLLLILISGLYVVPNILYTDPQHFCIYMKEKKQYLFT